MTRTTYFASVIVSVVLAAPAPALGQPSSPDVRAAEARRGAPSTIMVHHHASTAMEGYLRGLADYLRAQYEGQVQMAEAALINESVFEKSIHNDDLFVKTKVAQKEARDNRRRQHTGEVALENLRRAATQRAAIVTGACELLSGASDGLFEWPAAFNSRAFAGEMAQIESLLERWPQDAVKPSSGDRQELAAFARELRKGLRENRGGARFADRVSAMETVKQLELLATLDYADLREASTGSNVR